eukprot:m.110385 g.110385  ORF g.110385 m.110385 type:complete len:141 (+) comp9219_c4_seq2:316-738(+)
MILVCDYDLLLVFFQDAEIEKVVSFSQVENLEPLDVSRAQVILADEERLKDMGRKYDSIRRNEECLNSKPLQDVPNSMEKLQSLKALHIDQINASEEHKRRVMNILEAYNTVVMLISKQFMEWDAVLTSLEREKALAASK